MATKKLSELAAITSVADNDLLLVSQAIGGGLYESKKILNANFGSSTVHDNSANWNDTRATLMAQSGMWEDVESVVVAYSAQWEESPDIDYLSGIVDLHTASLGSSANWNDSRSTLISNSGIWNNVDAVVVAGSAKWDSNFATVSSTSGTWNQVHSTVLTHSGMWEDVESVVVANSASWEESADITSISAALSALSGQYMAGDTVDINYSASNYQAVTGNISGHLSGIDSGFSNIKSHSGMWENVESVVVAGSAKWDSDFSTTSANSGTWNQVHSTVLSHSGMWENVESVVVAGSAKWDSDFSTVSANSGNWDNTRSTVQSNSASWATPILNYIPLSGSSNISGDLIPIAPSAYSLGTSALPWKDLYVASGSIHIGGVTLSTSGSTLLVDGSQLTVSPATSGTLGGVKIGSNMFVEADGTISSADKFGTVYPAGLVYPPSHNDTYVKATSYWTTYYPYLATDPAKSLIGGGAGTTWFAGLNQITDQRFHIDLGTATVVAGIYYENYHESGSMTTRGVKTFTLWGSNSATAFATLTYATNTDWNQLTTDITVFAEHTGSNIADPKYIAVTSGNTRAYRYYAIKIADAWGSTDLIGIRRIVLRPAVAYIHPNHSGDVTSVADGAQTIAAGAVTFDKMASVNPSTLIGRAVGSDVGALSALTSDSVRSILGTSLMGTLTYPPAHNSTYVKATTEGGGFESYKATNPSNPLTGATQGWAASAATNQRFHIDLGAAALVNGFCYANEHNGSGLLLTYGVKNFTLWGSNDPTAFATLTYATDTNWVQLTPEVSQLPMHVVANIDDLRYVAVTNTVAYRYYAWKFADNWGGASICIRRLALIKNDHALSSATHTGLLAATQLPIATSGDLGGVKIGDGLSITLSGVLSIPNSDIWNDTQSTVASNSAIWEWDYTSGNLGSISGTSTVTFHTSAGAEQHVAFLSGAAITIETGGFDNKKSSIYVVLTDGGAATSIDYGSIKCAGKAAPTWTAVSGVDEFLLFRTGDGAMNLAVGRLNIGVIP